MISWGLDLTPDTNTYLLSQDLSIDNSIYYTAKECTDIFEAFNFNIYNEKIKKIQELKLDKQVEDALKLLACRFIRVNFETIADYYCTTMNEKEKSAIKLLRLVLIDGGENGFLEDKINEIYNNITNICNGYD